MNNIPTAVDGGDNPVLEEGLYHLVATVQPQSSVGTCDWVGPMYEADIDVDAQGNVVPDAFPGLTDMLKCQTEYPDWEQITVNCQGFGGTLLVKGHMDPGVRDFASGFSVAKGDTKGCTRVGLSWQATLRQ